MSSTVWRTTVVAYCWGRRGCEIAYWRFNGSVISVFSTRS